MPTAAGHHVPQNGTGREGGKGRERRASQHAAPRPWRPPGTAGPPVTEIGQHACKGQREQGGGREECMPACGTAAPEAPVDRGPPCHTACGTAASETPDDRGPPCHSACGTAASETPDDRGPPCHTSRVERKPLCHTKGSGRARGRQCEGGGWNGFSWQAVRVRRSSLPTPVRRGGEDSGNRDDQSSHAGASYNGPISLLLVCVPGWSFH